MVFSCVFHISNTSETTPAARFTRRCEEGEDAATGAPGLGGQSRLPRGGYQANRLVVQMAVGLLDLIVFTMLFTSHDGFYIFYTYVFNVLCMLNMILC